VKPVIIITIAFVLLIPVFVHAEKINSEEYTIRVFCKQNDMTLESSTSFYYFIHIGNKGGGFSGTVNGSKVIEREDVTLSGFMTFSKDGYKDVRASSCYPDGDERYTPTLSKEYEEYELISLPLVIESECIDIKSLSQFANPFKYPIDENLFSPYYGVKTFTDSKMEVSYSNGHVVEQIGSNEVFPIYINKDDKIKQLVVSHEKYVGHTTLIDCSESLFDKKQIEYWVEELERVEKLQAEANEFSSNIKSYSGCSPWEVNKSRLTDLEKQKIELIKSGQMSSEGNIEEWFALQRQINNIYSKYCPPKITVIEPTPIPEPIVIVIKEEPKFCFLWWCWY